MLKLRKGLAGKATLAASAALLAVALPSAGLAFVSLSDSDSVQEAGEALLAFTPADGDPRLAQAIAERRGSATMMRFTPAGAASAPGARSVTVAVRVDQQTADALAASSLVAPRNADTGTAGLRVAPTRYNLGLARGYSSFAAAPVAGRTESATRAVSAPSLSRNLSSARIPDLAQFTPRTSTREEPSRFAARIDLEQDKTADDVAVSGETLRDQMLDVGGSYRLTRNLDITAGVRYEQDRDLIKVPDLDQQDSQAVYVGTQFRF
ncbi:hypothetical protein [Aurantiacibacter odishensis]|uniref:hypothetical protein n=1 Tax=Aurantiacibacter odishensis TaxID=1155476 RepID=UPI000E71365E|nr:hypothetical protein [Aurantiacibacter odishensis]